MVEGSELGFLAFVLTEKLYDPTCLDLMGQNVFSSCLLDESSVAIATLVAIGVCEEVAHKYIKLVDALYQGCIYISYNFSISHWFSTTPNLAMCKNEEAAW